MNDLISRQAVKEMLSKQFEGTKEKGSCACSAYIEGGRTDIFYAIDNIPTVYDVDRVVEQIEIDNEHTFHGCINKGYAISPVKGAVKNE